MATPSPESGDLDDAAIDRFIIEQRREEVASACKDNDMAKLWSLWQTSIDLFTRTTVTENFRAAELRNLLSIAFGLARLAHARQKPREALQKLRGLLQTLMPLEWFGNELLRSQVRAAIVAASPEVEDLCLASLPSAPTDVSDDPEPAVLPPTTAGRTHPEERPRLDEHVERAFDLLRHYQQFLCDRHGGRTPDDDLTAIANLEQVLLRWLPLASQAGDPLIDGVAGAVGDRKAAAALLGNVNLWQACNKRLQTLSATTVPAGLDTTESVAAFRREVQHWRELLPRVWRGADGGKIDESDRTRARWQGGFWSGDLARRPSISGASYSLACGCDAVAASAAREKVAAEILRPAIHLAHSLREHPNWASVAEDNVVAVLDQQIELTRKVDRLVTELNLAWKARVEENRSSTSHSRDTDAPPARERVRRRKSLGRVDRALVTLLFQDLATGWKQGVLHMSTKTLAQCIRGTGSAPLSGSLRPSRTPHFRAFREFFARNPKGRPLDLIRAVPDSKLREALEQYAAERSDEAE